MGNNFTNKLKAIRSIIKGNNISYTQNAAFILGGTPRFTNYNKDRKILELEYYENPVYSAIADIRANYIANAEYKIKNNKTGEVISFDNFREQKMNDVILKNMFRLIRNPNPLQSTKEFFGLQSIMKDTFGNSYTYGNFAGVKQDIKTIGSMWGVYPQYMWPTFYNNTGIRLFTATDKQDLFKGWEFRWNAATVPFELAEILHRKDANIQFNIADDLILGKSKLISLQKPLSNIKIAYESRNIIAQDRGMRGIISSAEGDDSGKTPMTDPNAKKQLQDDFTGAGGYGFRSNQNQFLITTRAIDFQNVDQDVRKLGLMDEIASDAMIVANKYSVPEILVKLYLQGATFENQENSERRMYQNAIIPETKDHIEDINNWLNVREYGYEYMVSFDHVAVLQEDMKNRSQVNLNQNRVYKDIFFGGGCTYNTWLKAVGAEEIEEGWANLRITEMTPEDIAIITGKFNLNIQTDGNQGQEE